MVFKTKSIFIGLIICVLCLFSGFVIDSIAESSFGNTIEGAENMIRKKLAQTRKSQKDIKNAMDSLPDIESPKWDESRALELVTLPLSGIDRPHGRPKNKGYLYETNYSIKSDYEDKLSFYGCGDWHSAVNSTWTIVKVLKEFPGLPVGRLIREKLENHLSKNSLEGELTFFEEIKSKGFERPYGWAWLLKLYAELSSWEDEDAEKWTENLAPLAELLRDRSIEYLNHLSYPVRIGTHENTAFSLTFMLEYAKTKKDKIFEEAILTRAKDFYANDLNCPLYYEPSGSDFFSPCLTEAVLMSNILNQEEFIKWLDRFIPDVRSSEFQSLALPIEMQKSYLPESIIDSIRESKEKSSPESKNDTKPEDKIEKEDKLVGARSHLIGLSLYRAAALKIIAAALPKKDSRRQVYLKLAAILGQKGLESLFDADYFGTHWLATYAVYMLSEGGRD